MSRRGRTSRAAVSLFSFQDIITSVTAIMILLVLILTLELIERSERRGVAAADREVAGELRDAVDALEDEAEALKAELSRLQASALSSASFSERDIRRATEESLEETARLTREIDLLESQRRMAAAARRRAEEEAISEHSRGRGSSIADVDALNTRAEEIERANRAELERQAATEEAAQSSSPVPTLVFNTPDSETLRPRIIDVSEAGLTVLPIDSIPARTFPRPGVAFERWLAGLDKKAEYVVVLLRPSGIPFYREALESAKAAGLAVGAELIGESMPVTIRGGK